MSRHRYRTRGRRRSAGRSQAGIERAKRHIREAEELSRQLGGTDEDVKRYFLSLPQHQLRSVLDDYGRKYGRDKQEYAEFAIPLWMSGRRKMSGLVVARLYEMLPPRMPLARRPQKQQRRPLDTSGAAMDSG